MSSVIGKQVKAFGDSVIEAYREAMAYWSVQDVALAGPVIVQLVMEIVERRRAESKPEPGENEGFIQVCRDLLIALTDAREMIAEISRRGYEVKGAVEFSEAILEIRELLANLQEPSTPQPLPHAGIAYDDLAATSKTQQPPQSWFEEDVRGLRGPGH
jgi:hypothetical protein